jgi:hypothetical protein
VILKVDNGLVEAIVDDEHVDLSRYGWRTDKHGYVYRKSAGKRIFLHHVVGDKPPCGMVTDHINRNKLDNTKLNLRHLMRAHSQQNVGPQKRNRSGLRGAQFDRSCGKWKAMVRCGGESFALGYYQSAVEAGYVASEWRRAHMPFANEDVATPEGGGAPKFSGTFWLETGPTPSQKIPLY